VNLEYLRILVDIVDHGSLSAAARARGISQPAVTKQLQRLEAEAGLALLVRGPRREVELTPAGERVLAFARDVRARLATLEQELAALKTAGPGTLALAASTIPGEYLLPRLLAAFRVEAPQVRVTMSIADTAGVVDRVLADEADLGVIGAPPPQPGLHFERLVGDEVILAVPAGHRFAGREEVAVEELRGQPLILREEGSGTRRSVEAALAAAGTGLDAADVVLSLGSTQAVLQAVEQGLGLGFVSARAAAPAAAVGRVACVRLAGLSLSRDLYLACLPQRLGDPMVALFLAFARKHLGSG